MCSPISPRLACLSITRHVRVSPRPTLSPSPPHAITGHACLVLPTLAASVLETQAFAHQAFACLACRTKPCPTAYSPRPARFKALLILTLPALILSYRVGTRRALSLCSPPRHVGPCLPCPANPHTYRSRLPCLPRHKMPRPNKRSPASPALFKPSLLRGYLG